jgi:hypothetical protein
MPLTHYPRELRRAGPTCKGGDVHVQLAKFPVVRHERYINYQGKPTLAASPKLIFACQYT